MKEIGARLADVRRRIDGACARTGRSPDEVTLVAVSKGHAASAITAAYVAGLRDFGENRVQEASSRIAALRRHLAGARWHLVGHLQTNKVRAALELFDILHSVDSERLARALSERASSQVRVLLEVNIGGEASKSGVSPDQAPALAERLGAMDRVELAGLMTVAPAVDDPQDVRPLLRRMRQLRDAIGLHELSMGMTDDFEVAIEEGLTLVRVGRAVFGNPPGRGGLTEEA
ncbi:MAG: YggS family pyridoxal phosphate-dependent enzyme [Dehalococcoidia bacterium]